MSKCVRCEKEFENAFDDNNINFFYDEEIFFYCESCFNDYCKRKFDIKE